MDDFPKYLIVLDCGCECVIVFNPILDHKQIAGSLEVVSAGFCRLPDKLNEYVSVWGMSTSLKIRNRCEIDAQLIQQQLYPQD